MGWWQATQRGGIGVSEDGRPVATGLLWGDDPADAMAAALGQIAAAFQAEWGRQPSYAEIRAGLEFALGGWDQATAAGAAAEWTLGNFVADLERQGFQVERTGPLSVSIVVPRAAGPAPE